MNKFCQECGQELIEKELEYEGMAPFCQPCESFRFPLYNVAVSIITINKTNGKILLIQQYGRAKKILVAGYVNHGERVEDTVLRELREETGLTASTIQFNQTQFFQPSNTLMCNFTAFVEDDSDFSPNHEIDDYYWYSPEEAKANIFPNSLAEKFLTAYLAQN
ncbi:NAD(+) diphosphatase [Streptococcus hongkongensis]|nr:NTP pyrophosphohydrolase [Streptococcus uberis]